MLAAGIVFSGLVALGGHRQPGNHFHFSIIGDRTGGAKPGVYGRVWREVDLLHPDFVINVGDTIQGGSDEVVEQQWNELRPLFTRYRHCPMYFTPGNHDIFSDFSERVFERETGRPAHYSFDYQGAHFTVLDNSRTTDLSKEQLRFLEQDLRAHRGSNPKFVFFHKPFWLLPIGLDSGEFELHKLARTYGVDFIISGHGHRFVRLARDGIVYMEVGSSGARMGESFGGENFAEGRFFHHVWVTVEGAKVSFTVKEIDGPRGRGRMFRARDWGKDGPAFDPEDPASSEHPPT